MSPTPLPGTPRLLRAINDRAALELLLDENGAVACHVSRLVRILHLGGGLSVVCANGLPPRV